MSKSPIQTQDAQKTFEAFRDFTSAEMMKASKKALSFAANILANQTKQNLLAQVPAANRPNPKYGDTLVDGVIAHLLTRNTNEPGAKVHIMGKRDSDSGTFRLRFFARGTKRNGKQIIAPHSFFQDAIAQANAQIVQSFEQVLAESIDKINNERK